MKDYEPFLINPRRRRKRLSKNPFGEEVIIVNPRRRRRRRTRLEFGRPVRRRRRRRVVARRRRRTRSSAAPRRRRRRVRATRRRRRRHVAQMELFPRRRRRRRRRVAAYAPVRRRRHRRVRARSYAPRRRRRTRRRRGSYKVSSILDSSGSPYLTNRRRHRRHRRLFRNPAGFAAPIAINRPMSYLIPMGIGAASFIAADMAPAKFGATSQWGALGVKAAVGFGGGMVIGKFMGRQNGYIWFLGAGINIAVQLINTYILKAMLPAAPVAGLGWGYPEVSSYGAFPNEFKGVGAFPEEVSGYPF